MKKGEIVFLVVVAGAVLLFAWGFIHGEQDRAANSDIRVAYEGRVTAIQATSGVTTVWLNSDQQVINIWGNPTSLLVGAEYRITLDGNGELVNAVILEDGE